MLLSIRGLSVRFHTERGAFQPLDGIDLDLGENDTLAVVGESGCGKSVLGYATMRLLDEVATVSGSVRLMGKEIYSMETSELRSIRGRVISLVPQSPSLAFNPVIRIGEQLRELIEKTGIERDGAARRRALDFLAKVGFSDPLAIYRSHPHRLSGGMREMALIAMAVSVDPKLIVADEPTKGLDPLSRKRILSVLHTLAGGTAMIMITHDLRAAATCDRIAVMYSGEIVEEGVTSEVLESPLHPYTSGLFEAQPSRGMRPIKEGSVDAAETVRRCKFLARCRVADNGCGEHPRLRNHDGGRRKVRCHHA